MSSYSLVEPDLLKKQDEGFINKTPEIKTTNATHLAPSSASSQPKQPEMWFNPSTNRWCSKSCRRYRELIRDQELIKRGLRPGPQQQQRPRSKKRKQMEAEAPPPPPKMSRGQHSNEPHSGTSRIADLHPMCQIVDPSKRVQPGDANFRQVRDAYFAKFGM